MTVPEWTKKIEYGLTNKSYLLQTNEILRIGSPKVNKLLDRENEIEILKLLKESNSNFTIKILDYGYNDNKDFFLKTKYLPFTYNLVQQKIDEEKIHKIFDVINKFKKINIKDAKIKTFNWKEELNKFKSNIKNPQIDLTEYEIELVKIFGNYKPKELVLSHNNLVKNNFLFNDEPDDKKVYLIDFEYSSFNDKLFDIASFISETLIYEEDKDIRKELIKKWVSLFKLEKDEINMVKKWIFYQNILSVFWANAMYDITKQKSFLSIMSFKYHEIKKMY